MADTSDSSLSPVKRALQELREMRAKLDAIEHAKAEPIAVIGMACRFPGGVNNAEDYWRLLANGVDAIREIPRDRWNIDAFYNPDPEAAGKILTRWGGFIEQVDQFDPAFFGISPREAEGMDPQHRILLEVTWEALENAGHAPDRLVGSATGVFTGISVSDYYSIMTRQAPEKLDVYLAQGTAHSAASGRISYMLGLQGPAISVDTACSSSLVATHLAIQSLRSGECRMALAGGVNLILLPEVHISFSRARMISGDGRCKTFDASADGFVRSEGCGIIVLKRLSDALTDGDNILAVIRGSAVNQDGRSSGLTAPNALAQEAVIRAALANAGVEPAWVSYVEAHGTGTSLGDPIEVQALSAALGANRPAGSRLKIGSVKTNLGHLESAAGIAGLMKTILILQHKQIPPHLHLNTLNPYILWSELPVDVPTQLSQLPASNGRYIADVSSFGFSGTNAHLVLESAPEALPAEPVEAGLPLPLHLLKLSARTPETLQALLQRFTADLAHSSASLADIAFTANAGRADLTCRLALAAATREEALAKLSAAARGEAREDVFTGTVVNMAAPEVVFLFSGHGSQYVHMGRQLYDTQPAFRAALDECAGLLKDMLAVPLYDILYPAQDIGTLEKMTYSQPALFAVEYALAKMWLSWGIRPTTVMGHSLGEYVAACISGVFNLPDALKLVCARGRLMDSLPLAGEMAAVFTDAATVNELIGPYCDDVSIAAFNGPNNTVISGVAQILHPLLEKIAERGIKTRHLAVTQAAHSHLLDPILDDFEAVARTVIYAAPRLGYISCLTGKAVAGDEVQHAGYWRNHLRQPVRFVDAVRTLFAEGYRTFIEIGPHPVLTSMVQRIEGAEGRTFVPSLRSGWQDWQQVLESAALLYTRGIVPDWNAFEYGSAHHRIPLPTYPWSHQRYWITAPTQPEPVIKADPPQARPVDDQAASFLQQVKFLPADEIEEETVEMIRGHVARILRLKPAEVADDDRLIDIGLDSLMAVELRNRLNKELGLEQKLSATLIFDHPTVQAIARHLIKAILPTNPEKLAQAIPVQSAFEAIDLAAREQEIADLSEAEAEARILQKLTDLGED